MSSSAVDAWLSKRPERGALALLEHDVGELHAAGADIALAVFGTMMVEQPSSRAIGTMFSPAAPPPATIALSRGLRPSLTVIS